MKTITTTLLAIALTLLPLSVVFGQEARDSFGFNGTTFTAPNDMMRLTGGGAYDLATGFVHAGGSFEAVLIANLTVTKRDGSTVTIVASSTSPVTLLGRWDAEALATQDFDGTGLLPAISSADDFVTMKAAFYIALDSSRTAAPPAAGDVASFERKMIVSQDNDPNFGFPTAQKDKNLWVQGFGFGTADPANFN